MKFPIDSPLLMDFRHKGMDHCAKQAGPLELVLVMGLLGAAASGGPRVVFASLVILLLSACLRWTHAQRSCICRTTEKFVYGRCSRGKRRIQGTRPGFDWAAPRTWLRGSDVPGDVCSFLQRFWDEVSSTTAERWLVPDLTMEKGYVITGDSVWLGWPMLYG